ncbi:Flp family type IVb pilin [Roseovarius aestuariivivens]|uniref:Flp family type IVb pilin n=1 Tax=Roseovarius aestuariivivens TaxID=1888910 RepID=UPI00107FF16F|nr:Flp family type IVb pilin [Roseovarius aestuariivivens]
MIKLLKKFAKDESGAAIVEYGLALLVVGSIAAGGFSYLGTQTNNNVLGACDTLGSATC